MEKYPQPRFEMISLDRLMINRAYQRKEKAHAEKIAKAFDFNKVGVLNVSPAKGKHKGKYYVWDGQHRYLALLILGYTEWLCEVTDYTVKQQAKAFGNQADLTRKPTLVERHRAMYVAGDEEAIAIQEAVEDAGLNIGNKAKGNAHSVRALYDIYQHYNASVLTDTMIVVNTTWPDESYGQASAMIGGVARMLGRFPEQVNVGSFVTLLKATGDSPNALLHKAKPEGYAGGSRGFPEFYYFTTLWNGKYPSNMVDMKAGEKDDRNGKS